MKVRKRQLQVGDELGVDWDKYADGHARRLKRKRDFDDVDPGLAIEAAKNAAKRMGKGVQAVRDKHFPLKYIWVQFADGKIKAGQPCPCGSRRLLRLHTHFVKCPECGRMLLQGRPGDAEDADSRPAIRLGTVTGLRMARLGRTEDIEAYRGYGEKEGELVVVFAEFRVDGVEGQLSPKDAPERADRVQIIPFEQLSDLFDISVFSDRSESHWDIVF